MLLHARGRRHDLRRSRLSVGHNGQIDRPDERRNVDEKRDPLDRNDGVAEEVNDWPVTYARKPGSGQIRANLLPPVLEREIARLHQNGCKKDAREGRPEQDCDGEPNNCNRKHRELRLIVWYGCSI